MDRSAHILEELKGAGFRLTKSRRACAEVLAASEVPLSGPQILDALRCRKIAVNKTTVYRELDRLQALGIIETVQLGDRRQYYELSSREHHHHLVCLGCERVEDIGMDERLLRRGEERARDERQFSVLRHSLEFFGLCRTCQAC